MITIPTGSGFRRFGQSEVMRVDRGFIMEQQDSKSSRKPVRAARYVRMSTEHQQHSTENQADAIVRYAEQHGMEIVATYADSGQSGLTLAEKEEPQEL
jgi:predicted site-specific integrase-resolvase